MGTDIWFFVEKRYYKEYEQLDGTWRKINKSKEDLVSTSIWLSVDKWTVNGSVKIFV